MEPPRSQPRRPSLAQLGRYIRTAPGYAKRGEATHLCVNAATQIAAATLLRSEYLLWPKRTDDSSREPRYLTREEIAAVPMLAAIDALVVSRRPRRRLWVITWADQTTVLYQAPTSSYRVPSWFADLLYAAAQVAPLRRDTPEALRV